MVGLLSNRLPRNVEPLRNAARTMINFLSGLRSRLNAGSWDGLLKILGKKEWCFPLNLVSMVLCERSPCRQTKMSETNAHPPRNAAINRNRSDCISRSVVGHFDKEGNNVIHQSTFLPMIHYNFKTEHMKNCDLLEFKLG